MSLERKRWLAALLVVALLALVTYLSSDVVFQTNDDNAIVSAASGGVTGAPYAGNGFTSYLYGLLLSGLYRLSGGVPWHALLLSAAQLASLVCVLRSLLFVCDQRKRSPLWALLVFAGLYVGLALKFMTRLQFTATPGYCAAALAALLWTLPEGRRARTLCCLAGAMLMAFGLLLRLKGGLLSLPVPVLAGLAVWMKRDGTRRAAAIACAGLLALTAVTWVADGALYRANEPGWQEQAAFDEASAVLLDYNNNDATYELALQETDWTPELIACVRRWSLFFDARFNTENLSAIARRLEESASHPTLYELFYKTGSVFKRYAEFRYIALAFALAGLWALVRLLRRRRLWDALLLVALAGSAVLVVAYFYGWMNRFPDRVAFAYAWSAYCLAALVILDALADEAPLWAMRLGALALALATVATFAVRPGDALVLPSSGREARARLTTEVNAYAAAQPDVLFVTDITQSFYAFSTERPSVNLLEWGSAMMRSPMYCRKFEALGYANGFACENLADDSVRLLFADPASLERLMACLGTDGVPWQAVEEASEGMFTVYRLEAKS